MDFADAMNAVAEIVLAAEAWLDSVRSVATPDERALYAAVDRLQEIERKRGTTFASTSTSGENDLNPGAESENNGPKISTDASYPEGEHGPCRLECGHEGTCWDGDHIWLREGDTYVIGDARDGARNAAWQELRRAAEEALIVMKQGPDREEFWHLSKALSAVSQGAER